MKPLPHLIYIVPWSQWGEIVCQDNMWPLMHIPTATKSPDDETDGFLLYLWTFSIYFSEQLMIFLHTWGRKCVILHIKVSHGEYVAFVPKWQKGGKEKKKEKEKKPTLWSFELSNLSYNPLRIMPLAHVIVRTAVEQTWWHITHTSSDSAEVVTATALWLGSSLHFFICINRHLCLI